jgi:hypothetical protein
MHTRFWCGYPKERYNFEDIGMLEDNIKVVIKEIG